MIVADARSPMLARSVHGAPPRLRLRGSDRALLVLPQDDAELMTNRFSTSSRRRGLNKSAATDLARITMAKPVCGASDWYRASRVPGPCAGLWRGAAAANPLCLGNGKLTLLMPNNLLEIGGLLGRLIRNLNPFPRALQTEVQRIEIINQLRSLMLERGITVPQGRCRLERHLPEILSNERNGLTPRLRRLIEDMREEWRSIDRRIKRFNDELTQRARTEDAAKPLTRIPGIGVLTATALIAAVENAQTFTCGRDLAAWLGLGNRSFYASANAVTATCGCC